MMMWRVWWELLVTPSNMQRLMQSLTPRRVSHVIWPSLQNTCLLRSWLRRHSAQGRLGPDDQDSSLSVHWPGCGITCDWAGPPVTGHQAPVSRGHLSSPLSPLMMQYSNTRPGPASADLISPAAGPTQTSWSMFHAACFANNSSTQWLF